MALTEDQKYIKNCRIKLGLSQANFGTLVCHTQQAVSAWEKGVKNPEKIIIKFLINYMEGKIK